LQQVRLAQGGKKKEISEEEIKSETDERHKLWTHWLTLYRDRLKEEETDGKGMELRGRGGGRVVE
jgi:hypothetical protein